MANRSFQFDAAVAGALLVLGLVEEFFVPVDTGGAIRRHADFLGAVTVAAIVAPLLWRRTAPITVMAVTMAAYFARLALGYDPSSSMNAVQFVALYSVGVYAMRPAANWARLAAALVVAASFLLQVAIDRIEFTAAVISFGTWAGAGVLGETVYIRRRYQAVLEERAKLLEADRDEREKLAIQTERARIAREFHDIWAHTLSVVVVQAGAAEEVFEESPQLAKQALVKIQEAGRQALAEVRRLIASDMADPVSQSLDPVPTLSGLANLAEEMRRAGVPVELSVAGPIGDLPDDVSLTAYRVVQQALTNTLSHGGPGVHAEVDVELSDDRLSVEVRDDGRPEDQKDPDTPRRGRGLVGMRERVLLFGGNFTAGPRPEGGFIVRASIPVKARAP